MSKVFQTGDFARIKGNKGQLKHDALVYIAGSTLVPEEDDPYKRQVYFVVGEIVEREGAKVINTKQSYYINPHSLKACSPTEVEELTNAVEVQFKEIEEA